MNQQQFRSLNANFSSQVISAAKTRAVCMLIVSQRDGGRRASFLYQSGIGAQLSNLYSGELYRYDPHITEASSALTSAKTFASVRHAGQTSGGDGEASLKYWSSLKQAGIKETAACVRQISDNMFMLVGLLSDSNRQRIQYDCAAQAIEDWLERCSHHLLEYCLNGLYFDNAGSDPVADNALLTAREKAVTAQIFQGMSNKQISETLAISAYTVENHLRRIYQKFGVHNRTALIAHLNRARQNCSA
jgi:DNA-binding CsgD family transcriptional regulator